MINIESGMCRAKVGKFKNYDAHYNFNNLYLKKDNKDILDIIGIVNDGSVIDINTGVEYPILKHDENNNISINQDINLDTLYALDLNYINEKRTTSKDYIKAIDIKVKRLLKQKNN
ncbi:MAG: hypothetical protein J6G98_02770 [Bacilli bacterium]|nr:hypothetical protein [Bacilli bacterium]